MCLGGGTWKRRLKFRTVAFLPPLRAAYLILVTTNLPFLPLFSATQQTLFLACLQSRSYLPSCVWQVTRKARNVEKWQMMGQVLGQMPWMSYVVVVQRLRANWATTATRDQRYWIATRIRVAWGDFAPAAQDLPTFFHHLCLCNHLRDNMPLLWNSTFYNRKRVHTTTCFKTLFLRIYGNLC